MIALLAILYQQIEDSLLQMARDITNLVVSLLNVDVAYQGVKEKEKFALLYTVRPKGRDPTY